MPPFFEDKTCPAHKLRITTFHVIQEMYVTRTGPIQISSPDSDSVFISRENDVISSSFACRGGR